MFPRHSLRRVLLPAVALLCLVAVPSRAGSWTFSQGPHPTQTGEVIDLREDGQLVARFVYGTGQMKPYLHVFEGGIQLTKGDNGGTYPHHRGIFIGWDEIVSAGKTSDLWHLDDQSTMRVVAVDKLWSDARGVTLIARIEWRGSAAAGKPLLIEETRTLAVSRPGGTHTQVEAFFQLRAAQALTLDGDRQHAGIHFRPVQEVFTRAAETSYLSQPQGTDGITGPDLRWCRLQFPLGTRWFSALELSAPGNPSLEISMRDYGRFGFFFRKAMVAGEVLSLHYRFITRETAAPAVPSTPSVAQLADWRAEAEAEYAAFVAEQGSDVDGDGQPLAAETRAGTNPFDAASRFRILPLAPPGGFEFAFLPAKNYRVWTAETPGAWTLVPAPIFTFPAPGTARWTDPENPLLPRRFYRLDIAE